MLLAATLLACTLAVGQAEPPPTGPRSEEDTMPPDLQATPDPDAEDDGEQAPPKDARAAITIEPAKDPLPHMQWDVPVYCAYLVPTKAVPSGEFRLQCDDVRKECLVSSAREIDEDGVETREPLQRTQSCSYSRIDWAKRSQRGWRFVPAVAEAAPGWFRDARGRVMQFNFDLNRRVFLGAAWAPLWLRSEDGLRNNYRAEFGIQIEFPDDERETLFRIHLLEGEFNLPDNSGTLTTFRYDWSHRNSRPVARISTFIGKPRRVDLDLNLGGYLEALTFDTIRRGGVTDTQLLLGTAQPTFDLWHSKDLVSFFRLRAGPALTLDTEREVLRFMGQAAAEADFTIDPDGFHHVRLSAEAEQLFFARINNRPPQRLRVGAEYEVVFVAINDQPLSLVLNGRGGWRNDLQGYPAGWEWAAGAGLRFSLWAPARRNAPSLEKL